MALKAEAKKCIKIVRENRDEKRRMNANDRTESMLHIMQQASTKVIDLEAFGKTAH